jgi:hypothetical protein
MTTTALFVELVVIGVGAVLWVILAVLALFGYSWVTLTFEQATSVTSLVPLLSFAYLLGIIVDRIADQVFAIPASRLRARWFAEAADYYRARDIFYLKAPTRDLAEYNRSRLRICRGWAINCAAAITALNAFVWAQLPNEYPRLKIASMGSVIFLLLCLGALNAWRELSTDAYERLKEQTKLLLEEPSAQSS